MVWEWKYPWGSRPATTALCTTASVLAVSWLLCRGGHRGAGAWCARLMAAGKPAGLPPTVQKQAGGAAARTGRQPPERPELKVVFKDDNYCVVDKPADVRIDGDHEHTVEKMLYHKYPDVPKFRLIHQLDYATSGLMVWGVNKRATSAASKLFQKRAVSKLYLALVCGTMTDSTNPTSTISASTPAPTTTFDWSVADDPTHPFKMCIGTPGNPGRVAHTECRVLAWGTYRSRPVTQVALRPSSGRRHQLRLHTMAAGHPIVGDATYTDDDQSPRMMLHAAELTLPLPTGTMTWKTDDPFSHLITDMVHPHHPSTPSTPS